MIQFYGGTDKGNRKHNEDCDAANNELGIGLVADGMGGYACGEVASVLVKETLIDALIQRQGLSEAIVRAHYLIKAESERDESKSGMGSTVVAVKVQDNDYEIAWVGDSRAYIWDGELKQITRDHSYVENLLNTGAITFDEARVHPNRNLITQAVGVAGEEGLEVSVVRGRLAGGQYLLLCSDGLVDEVADVDVAKFLENANSSQEMVDTLIAEAIQAGGRDNISVVIAESDAESSGLAIEPEIICTTSLDGVVHRQAPIKANSQDDINSSVTYMDDNKGNEFSPYRWGGRWLLAVLVISLIILITITV